MLREKLKNITIKDLLEDGKISKRTSNRCLYAGFESLMDILEYHKAGQEFTSIRNAGRKTCLELETLCKGYTQGLELSISENISCEEDKNSKKQNEIENLIKTNFINAIENKLINGSDILSYLNDTQKEIFEKIFNRYIEDCSVRTRNRLNTIGFENFVIEYLFTPNNTLLNIEGFGKKSLQEAADLKNKMKEELTKLIHSSEEEFSKLHLFYQKGDIILNDFVSNFYNDNNHLPMFWILEQELLLNENRSIQILVNSFPIFRDCQVQTLDEIAKKNNLTRERVRQIRNNIFNKALKITDEIIEYKNNNDALTKYFRLLQNRDDWGYILEFLQEKEIINQKSFEIQKCLKNEHCNLSFEFALQLIGYLFLDTFSLFGGFEISNKDRVWENTFLIRKEYTDIFDFEKVKEEFSQIVIDSTSDCLLDLNNYIATSQCWKQFNFDKKDEITSIVKDILLYEFGLYSENIDGNQIKIPASKKRNLSDVVYEILQTKGEPMHLEDIFIQYKKIMPEHKYTQENNANKLRPYLQKHPDIAPIKRSSTYMLKEWKHIRSGHIRDAIREFLSEQKLPQTVDAIFEYVLQYFPETNSKSVSSSMSSHDDFIKFQNGLFGLSKKEYPADYKIIDSDGERKTFEQRLTDLEKFIVENDHFPFSSSEDQEEEALNRWWNRVIKGKQIINQKQKVEVDRIKATYASFETDKNAYEWDLNYNKLKMFILENKRVPFAKGGEKFLYGWLRRAKNDFSNYRLSEEQRKKYIELAKLI